MARVHEIHSLLHGFTGWMVLFGTATSAMRLLSADRSNPEYLNESCIEPSSRKEFHGSRVRQIESMIGQWRIQIEQKLEHAQKTTAEFEQQMLSQAVPNADYSSELNSLSSIVRTFVHESQQQSRSELECKRKMLVC